MGLRQPPVAPSVSVLTRPWCCLAAARAAGGLTAPALQVPAADGGLCGSCREPEAQACGWGATRRPRLLLPPHRCSLLCGRTRALLAGHGLLSMQSCRVGCPRCAGRSAPVSHSAPDCSCPCAVWWVQEPGAVEACCWRGGGWPMPWVRTAVSSTAVHLHPCPAVRHYIGARGRSEKEVQSASVLMKHWEQKGIALGAVHHPH